MILYIVYLVQVFRYRMNIYVIKMKKVMCYGK